MRRNAIRAIKRRALMVLAILLAAVVPREAAAQRVETVLSLRAGAVRVYITASSGANVRGLHVYRLLSLESSYVSGKQ